MRHRAHRCDAEHLPSTLTAQQKTARRNADGKLLTSCRDTEEKVVVRSEEGVNTNLPSQYMLKVQPSSPTHTHSSHIIHSRDIC